MTENLEVGEIVKYSKPAAGEENLRFHLLENNGDRVSIQLICEWRIKPIETVAVGEIERA